MGRSGFRGVRVESSRVVVRGQVWTRTVSAGSIAVVALEASPRRFDMKLRDGSWIGLQFGGRSPGGHGVRRAVEVDARRVAEVLGPQGVAALLPGELPCLQSRRRRLPISSGLELPDRRDLDRGGGVCGRVRCAHNLCLRLSPPGWPRRTTSVSRVASSLRRRRNRARAPTPSHPRPRHDHPTHHHDRARVEIRHSQRFSHAALRDGERFERLAQYEAGVELVETQSTTTWDRPALPEARRVYVPTSSTTSSSSPADPGGVHAVRRDRLLQWSARRLHRCAVGGVVVQGHVRRGDVDGQGGDVL